MSSIGSSMSRMKMPGFDLKNHFKNTNSILIVCVVIVILIALIGYKFSKCFMPSGLFGSSSAKEAKEVVTKKDSLIVTPQCLLGALSTEGAAVLVVNVLSEKMPVFIGVGQPDEQRSISKGVFEEMLSQSNGQVPKNVDMVILMCAGWSCSAAKNYIDELHKRGVDISKIVDYAGGLHEWCVYNTLNPQVFKLYNLRKPDENRVSELTVKEVNTLLANTAHGYNTNTLIEKEQEPVSSLCKVGEGLPSLLVPSVTPENGGESGPAPVPETPPEESA